MNDDNDRDFAALTDRDIWEEAKDRLKVATDADSDNRSRAREAIAFREGEQWDQVPGGSVSQDEPELTINLTDAMCDRVENNIRQQRPRGKVHPVGDGADVEIAEIINGIGRHIEARSEASVAYDMAAAAAINGGFGFFRLVAEFLTPKSFQKDLRILPIRNQFTVSMDPSAIMPHGGDSMWTIISVKMKRLEYKRRYPKAQNATWADTGNDALRRDWEDREDIRLAEYFRIREVPERLYLIRGQGGEEFTKYLSEMPRRPDGKLMTIDEARLMLAERGLMVADDRESCKRQVEWFRLNGLTVVEREQIPGSFIPVFRVEGKAVDLDGQVRRRGMVESMQDPQRMVNYGEVAKIKRLGLTPKAPWVAAEGQLDGHPEWDDANQRAYSVLTYKPIVIETSSGPVVMPPPVRQPPAQIEQGFSEFVQGMRSNLMALAGMPHEPGQDQQGGPVVSGVALKRRQFMSDQSHFQYYDKLTLAIAQCWRVMVEWIPVYFSESRMQRIIGDDSVPEMVQINGQETDEESGVYKVKNDLSVGIYDVSMDTGPGYETKREEGAENLIQLVKIPVLADLIAKVAPDLVFRSIDHPYMEELADRLAAQTPDGLKKIMDSLPKRAKAIVNALSKENEGLKKALQEAEQEKKYGLAKAHLQATVKAHDIDTRAAVERESDAGWQAEERYDTDTKAHVALTVAEIGAAGKLLDSHVNAAHASEAAERMMNTANEAEKEQ
jgi:hypothetical protein